MHNTNIIFKFILGNTNAMDQLDVRPVITNNPRALRQGLVGVWRLYHVPVVPTQGAIPEKGEY